MLDYLPKRVSKRAIAVYFISLTIVSLAYWDYAMHVKFMAIGAGLVLMFFLGGTNLTRSWGKLPKKDFVRILFSSALILRLVLLLFAYYFYEKETGEVYGWNDADARWYHEVAEWYANMGWKGTWDWMLGNVKVSDMGYQLYLYLLYSIWGAYVVPTLVIDTFLSSFTCVLIYRLASREFDETVGRNAAVFCMLMPNMIYYCTVNLKETLMVFLIVAFMERADNLIRNRKFNVFNVILTIILASSLFLFRSVLGAVGIMAVVIGIFFSSGKAMTKGRKTLLLLISVVFLAVMAGGTVATEVEGYWNDRETNQDQKRLAQTMAGNQWAQYATAGVMAPMIFIVPYATMVNVNEQYTQQLLHGGNFVKNFMAIFTLFAAITLLFKNKKWQEHALTGSFIVGNLIVVAFSGFANSERFHFPVLPLLLMYDAYGLSLMTPQNFKYVRYWSALVVIMEVGWAYFKLGSRGLVHI